MRDADDGGRSRPYPRCMSRADQLDAPELVAGRLLAAVSEAPQNQDTYLTDGRRLFRVVRGFAWPPGVNSHALVEECSTLEIRCYKPDELFALGLRLVERDRTTQRRQAWIRDRAGSRL